MAEHHPMAPRSPNRAWHAAEANGAAGEKLSRGRRLVHVATAIVALAGVLVGLLFYIRSFRPPAFLVIPISEYSDPHWPANAQPAYDRAGNDLCRIIPDARYGFDMQQSHHLIKEVSTWAADKKKGFVIYLSALAVVKNNAVYLLPAQARAGDARTWLPLEDVLRVVRESPIANKVLLLDVMPAFADARLGLLTNPVAEYVEKLLAVSENRGLFVLCACEAGQVSLPARFLHRTIFDYYVTEGLRGAANGYGSDGKKNRRVSLRELAAFLRQRVDRYAFKVYQRHQTPRLFGPDQGDFELALASDDVPSTSPSETPCPEYPPELAEEWKTYAQWRDQMVHVAPQLVRKMGARLLRAEARWRAGRSWNKERQELEAALRSLRQAKTDAEAMVQTSLPGAPRIDAESAAILKRFLRRFDVPKHAELVNVKEAFLKQRSKNLTDRDLAWTVIAMVAEAADSGSITVHHLHLALDLCASLPVDSHWQSPALWNSILKLRPDKKAFTVEEQDLVKRAIRVQGLADRVSALDPRVFAFVQLDLDRATLSEKKAADSLKRRHLVQARAPLEQAEHLFSQVFQRADRVGEMQAACDRAMLLLPESASYILRLARRDAQLEGRWHATATAARDIFMALDSSSAATADFTQLRAWSDIIEAGLAGLSRPFSTAAIATLCQPIEAHALDANMLWEVEALLSTPLPSAQDRIRLWKAGFDLERQLVKSVFDDDRNDDRAAGMRAMATNGGQRGHALTDERDHALRRAEFSVALLALGGLDRMALAKLHVTCKEALEKTNMSLDELGFALQTAWGKRPNSTEALLVRDRWSRVTDPFDAEVASGEGPDLPTARIRQQEVVQFTNWLRDRAQAAPVSPP